MNRFFRLEEAQFSTVCMGCLELIPQGGAVYVADSGHVFCHPACELEEEDE